MGEVGGRPNLPERTAVTSAQIREIENYLAACRSQITVGPDDRQAKARALLMLFSVLASEALPDQLAEARQAAYLDALEPYPGWAVREAARRWRDGENHADGENRNFVPKPAELLRLVRLVLAPAEAEVQATSRLLSAARERAGEWEEPTPESRARVAALAAEFTAPRTGGKATLYADAVASLERRAQANGVDFQTAFDSTPDLPERVGTFQKIGQ